MRARLRSLLGLALLTGSVGLGAPLAAVAQDVTVYKSPSCGCCVGWIEHLQAHGFKVKVEHPEDMGAVKQSLGLKRELASCHTATVGGYVVEGHVPASDIKRLLVEKPAVAGLAVPGMPMGSPGMEGPRKDPYEVLTFDRQGRVQVFSRH